MSRERVSLCKCTHIAAFTFVEPFYHSFWDGDSYSASLLTFPRSFFTVYQLEKQAVQACLPHTDRQGRNHRDHKRIEGAS